MSDSLPVTNPYESGGGASLSDVKERRCARSDDRTEGPGRCKDGCGTIGKLHVSGDGSACMWSPRETVVLLQGVLQAAMGHFEGTASVST